MFRKPLLQDVPGQKGVWTPPRGVSTAIFGDSFEDLSKKRADVDMWTGVSLLIIERRGVHNSWGALGGPLVGPLGGPGHTTYPPEFGGVLLVSTFGLPQIWLDGSFVICCQGRLCHWLYLTKTKRIIRRVRTVSIIVFKG